MLRKEGLGMVFARLDGSMWSIPSATMISLSKGMNQK